MKNSSLEEGRFRFRAVLLTVLAFLSGGCALAYEVLYLRALTTVFGDMFYVHAALLGSFLAGIGMGAKLASSWRRWLFAFEIVTGLHALALPFALKWLVNQPVMNLFPSSPLLTILATMACLAVPSLMIGCTIPLFSACVRVELAGHRSFTGIYQAYNLGALLSILLVEFVFVRFIGITASLFCMGAINLSIGAILFVCRSASACPPVANPRSFPRRETLALALASFGSALFQMFFLKLSQLVFGPLRENFAIGLSIILLGIFLGAGLASKTRLRLETFLLLIPLAIGLIYASYLPLLQLHRSILSWAGTSELLVIVGKLAMGCLFALGPMILFGALIPALMRSEDDVAGESGHLLWISGLANAAGYLAYVLIGHPFLNSGLLLALVGTVAFLASLLAAGFRWSRFQMGLAAAGVVFTFLMVRGWEDRNFYLARWAHELKPRDEVIVFKSGAESATLLRTADYEWISYNGHSSIYIQQHGIVTLEEMVCGIVPALDAPRHEKALVIGLGSGITAGTCSRIFKAVDVVEINEAFFQMLPSLRHAHMDIGHNPAAALHLGDGRTFLLGKEGVYDAIIINLPAPTYFSASKLYTVEFYDRVLKALKPDGIFCTWLAVPNMSENGVRTILSTLQTRFRYCELRILAERYYMVTCSNQPIHPGKFSGLPAQPIMLRQLKDGLKGFDPDEYFQDIRMSENLFATLPHSFTRENTDDHPVLEFMLARSLPLRRMAKDPFLEQQAMFSIDPVRRPEAGDPARFARRAAAYKRLDPALFEQNFLPALCKDPKDWAAWETHK